MGYYKHHKARIISHASARNDSKLWLIDLKRSKRNTDFNRWRFYAQLKCATGQVVVIAEKNDNAS